MKLTPATLFEVCEPVEHGADVSELIAGMWELLRTGVGGVNGVGLAANQVGDRRRVIVLNTDEIRMAIINPVITKRCCGTVNSIEGCLSFFGGKRQVKIIRDKQVTLEGFDKDWNPIKIKLRGLASRAAQHEVDHLDAVTIFPKAYADAERTEAVQAEEKQKAKMSAAALLAITSGIMAGNGI